MTNDEASDARGRLPPQVCEAADIVAVVRPPILVGAGRTYDIVKDRFGPFPVRVSGDALDSRVAEYLARGEYCAVVFVRERR